MDAVQTVGIRHPTLFRGRKQIRIWGNGISSLSLLFEFLRPFTGGKTRNGISQSTVLMDIARSRWIDHLASPVNEGNSRMATNKRGVRGFCPRISLGCGSSHSLSHPERTWPTACSRRVGHVIALKSPSGDRPRSTISEASHNHARAIRFHERRNHRESSWG
jgi:hypothetical protein